jgi:superfamily I DNA and RNA helicase
MDRLKAELSCVEMPLSITYRCPLKVVELAQRYEPALEAAPNAAEGIVRDGGDALNATYEPDDLVICRFTAPVMKLAYSLLSRGVRVRVIGRDLAEGLKSLVYRLKPATTKDLFIKLGAWETAQVEALVASDASDDKIEAVRDRVETLRTVAADASSVEQVLERIEALFADKTNAVVLSTVHRAKGLEANRVFIIDHERRAFARTAEQHQQENNLAYVALTRTKSALYFITSEV